MSKRDPRAPGDPGTAVVVGGGVAGLASAALLAREGHAVTLLEKNADPGGRAGRWHTDGFRFDTGPSWYLMPDVFDHFFALFDTTTSAHLNLVRLDPAYRVFFEGQRDPVDVRSGRAEVIALFERLQPGVGRRMSAYLDSAEETYHLAVRRFLYTTYESLTPLVRPDLVRRLGRLMRLLAQPLDRFVARYVTDHRLAQILGYPAVFLGSSPDRAPSMYHLMSHLDLVDGVRYPMGGFSALVDALLGVAEREGVEVRLGSTAVGIDTAPGSPSSPRPHVHAVRFTDQQGVERSLPADVVVGATDLHHVEHQLLPAELRSHSPRWWARRDPGPGAVLVMLGVSGQLPELAHHSLFFTRDWSAHFDAVHRRAASIPDPASIYVCRPSATDPSVAPPGAENLFVLVPVPASTDLGRGGVDGAGDPWVEQVADAAVAQIASWAGVPDLADRVVVRRTVGPQDFADDVNAWSGSALGLAHTLRQSAFLRPRTTSRKVAGLYYAGHSTLPGIGLPMCLISAEVLLKTVRDDRSTEPLATPLPRRMPRLAADLGPDPELVGRDRGAR